MSTVMITSLVYHKTTDVCLCHCAISLHIDKEKIFKSFTGLDKPSYQSNSRQYKSGDDRAKAKKIIKGRCQAKMLYRLFFK